MKRIDEQNPLLIANGDIMSSIYRSMPVPKHYEPISAKLKLPISKYHDAEMFLDSYLRNNNKAMQTLCLASISPELARNETEMLKIIKFAPEAIYQVPEENMDIAFIAKALAENPLVYDCLPKDFQKDPLVMNMYTQSFLDKGISMSDITLDSWDPRFTRYNPQEVVPLFSYAVSKACDPKIFYSVENYEKAYEKMIKAGIVEDTYRTHRGEEFHHNKYAKPLAYLQMANMICRDPKLKAQYKAAEFRAINKNMDHLVKIIKQDPTSPIAKKIAEAVVMAEEYFKQNPTYEMIQGQNQQIGLGLTQQIEKAEKEFYQEMAQQLKNCLEKNEEVRFGRLDIRTSHASYIDTLIEMAMEHPEMGISQDTIENWWISRGEDFVFEKGTMEMYIGQYNNKMDYLEDLLTKHPEMQIGIDRATIDQQKQSSQDIEQIT